MTSNPVPPVFTESGDMTTAKVQQEVNTDLESARLSAWSWAYGPKSKHLSKTLRRRCQKIYDRAERRARKAEAAKRMPFSGVFYPGESINPPHNPRGAFTGVPISPIVALLMIQAAMQNRRFH